MFYIEEKNNFYFVKSEKDFNRFWPFKNLWCKWETFWKTKEYAKVIKKYNLKTWNSWIWELNELIIYKEWEILNFNKLYESWEDYLILVKKIWNFLSFNTSFFKTEEIKLTNKLTLEKVFIWKNNFEKILPILNWFFWKYLFYKWLTKIPSDLSNIFEIDFNPQKIKNLEITLKKIKKDINNNVLMTNSKKEEFRWKITESLFEVLKLIIQTFWIIEETKNNKDKLKKIWNNSNTEYSSEAKLLLDISWTKISNLEERLKSSLLVFNEYLDTLESFKITF